MIIARHLDEHPSKQRRAMATDATRLLHRARLVLLGYEPGVAADLGRSGNRQWLLRRVARRFQALDEGDLATGAMERATAIAVCGEGNVCCRCVVTPKGIASRARHVGHSRTPRTSTPSRSWPWVATHTRLTWRPLCDCR